MFDWVPDVNLINGTFVSVLRIVALGGPTVVVLTMLRHSWRRMLLALAIGAVTGLLGIAVTWFVSDVLDTFGVSLGWLVMRRVGLTFAEIGLLLSVAVLTHAWRRWLSIVLLPVVLLFGVLQVNGAFGQYRSLREALGLPKYQALSEHWLRTADETLDTWRAQAHHGLSSHGIVGTVEIPGTVSGFPARDADIYLPPAALTDDAPALPVIVAMVGQPGEPNDMFTAGNLASFLDAYAAAHDGVAPVVVVPDQLATSYANPMCADTTQFGNSKTYLTHDVVAWIEANLPVSTDRTQWAMGGFSQGATCTMQLGPTQSDRYATLFAIASELEPTNGTVQQMIDQYFGGDADSYSSQTPLHTLADNSPSDQALYLASGSDDPISGQNIDAFTPVALASGRTVDRLTSEDTGHTWYTVQRVLPVILDRLGVRFGLADQETPVSAWGGVEEEVETGSVSALAP